MEREKAALGLFLTLNEPTREMEKEAASAGLYEPPGMKVPKLQILTAAQIQLAKNGCFRASERQGARARVDRLDRQKPRAGWTGASRKESYSRLDRPSWGDTGAQVCHAFTMRKWCGLFQAAPRKKPPSPWVAAPGGLS